MNPANAGIAQGLSDAKYQSVFEAVDESMDRQCGDFSDDEGSESDFDSSDEEDDDDVPPTPPRMRAPLIRLQSYRPPLTATSPAFVKKYHSNINVISLPSSPGTITTITFTNAKSRGITLIYSHGNAEDLGQLADRLQQLSRCLCVDVVGYDYRGYGTSLFTDDLIKDHVSMMGGKPSPPTKVISEATVKEDVELVYAWVALERGVAPSQVFLYGRSLGTAPSAHLAAVLTSNKDCPTARLANSSHVSLFDRIRRFAHPHEGKRPLLGGLLLQSPMKSCIKTKLDIGGPSSNLDAFPTETYLPFVECPVFIVHGSKDRVVPPAHGRYLYALAVSARDRRWALKEKRKRIQKKEDSVVIWIQERKAFRRQERARAAANAKLWKESLARGDEPGVTRAPTSLTPEKGGSAVAHIQPPPPPPDASSRRRAASAPVAKKSTSEAPPTLTPAPVVLYVVPGARHNDLESVAGVRLVNEARSFMMSALRFNPPQHQRPLLTSPQARGGEGWGGFQGDVRGEEEEEKEEGDYFREGRRNAKMGAVEVQREEGGGEKEEDKVQARTPSAKVPLPQSTLPDAPIRTPVRLDRTEATITPKVAIVARSGEEENVGTPKVKKGGDGIRGKRAFGTSIINSPGLV